jgi:hypothetical protein
MAALSCLHPTIQLLRAPDRTTNAASMAMPASPRPNRHRGCWRRHHAHGFLADATCCRRAGWLGCGKSGNDEAHGGLLVNGQISAISVGRVGLVACAGTETVPREIGWAPDEVAICIDVSCEPDESIVRIEPTAGKCSGPANLRADLVSDWHSTRVLPVRPAGTSYLASPAGWPVATRRNKDPEGPLSQPLPAARNHAHLRRIT